VVGTNLALIYYRGHVGRGRGMSLDPTNGVNVKALRCSLDIKRILSGWRRSRVNQTPRSSGASYRLVGQPSTDIAGVREPVGYNLATPASRGARPSGRRSDRTE
jgi:hypothetical protein